MFPAGAFEVTDHGEHPRPPWWLAAPELLREIEQRPYVSRGAAAYQLGDGMLALDADDRVLLEGFTHLYGDCAVSDAVSTPVLVRCRLRRSLEPPLVVLRFEAGAPADPAAAAYHLLRPTCAVPPFRVGDSPLPGWRLTGGSTGPVLAASGATVLMHRKLIPAEFLVEYLVGITLAAQPGMLPIHGASLCIGGAGVVLVGATHAGKTTTALHLAARGHTLLGDEVAAIRLASREIVPFRRAVNVRPGPHGRVLADALGLTDSRGDGTTPDVWATRHRIAALFPAQRPQPVPLRIVCFLGGFADAPAIEPFRLSLDREDVLGWITTPEIAYCSWGLDPARRALRLMVLKEALSRVPCWLITVGPPRDTVELIERTVEELAC